MGVQQAGGIEQLRSIAVAKGILADAVKKGKEEHSGWQSLLEYMFSNMKVELPHGLEPFEQHNQQLLASSCKFLRKANNAGQGDGGAQQLEDFHGAKGLLNDLLQCNESMREKRKSDMAILSPKLIEAGNRRRQAVR